MNFDTIGSAPSFLSSTPLETQPYEVSPKSDPLPAAVQSEQVLIVDAFSCGKSDFAKRKHKHCKMHNKNHRQFITVVASDTHVGSVLSQGREFLDFCKRKKPKRVVLAGDGVDFWLVGDAEGLRLFCEYMHELRTILGPDAEIIFITGNHDDYLRTHREEVRKLVEADTIIIANEVILKLPDGKNMLVVHGDIFDSGMEKEKRGLAVMATKALKIVYPVETGLAALARFCGRANFTPFSDARNRHLDSVACREVRGNVFQPIFDINEATYRTGVGIPIHAMLHGHSHEAAEITMSTPLNRKTGKPMGPKSVVVTDLGRWVLDAADASPDPAFPYTQKKPVNTFWGIRANATHGMYAYNPFDQDKPERRMTKQNDDGSYINSHWQPPERDRKREQARLALKPRDKIAA